MRFSSSTQRKRWSFSTENLRAIRKSNRLRSLEAIKKFQEENAGSENSQSATVKETKKAGKIKAVTLEEEQKLLSYYASTIQGICQALHLPDKVRATALTFLKRAYLSFSVLDQDPQNIMLACIFLAGKVEEHYIKATDLSIKAKQDEALVLKGETILLEALGFDLIVFSAYRPLQGFMMDLAELQSRERQSSENGTSKKEQLEPIRAKALGAIDALMRTDAPLLFPPGQLALAALRASIKNFGASFEDLLGHIATKAQNSAQPQGVALVPEYEADLRDALQQLDSFGNEGAAPVTKQEEYKDAAVRQRDQELQRRAAKAALKQKTCAAEEAKLLNGSSAGGVNDAAEEVPDAEEQGSHDKKRRRSQA